MFSRWFGSQVFGRSHACWPELMIQQSNPRQNSELFQFPCQNPWTNQESVKWWSEIDLHGETFTRSFASQSKQVAQSEMAWCCCIPKKMCLPSWYWARPQIFISLFSPCKIPAIDDEPNAMMIRYRIQGEFVDFRDHKPYIYKWFENSGHFRKSENLLGSVALALVATNSWSDGRRREMSRSQLGYLLSVICYLWVINKAPSLIKALRTYEKMLYWKFVPSYYHQ